MEYAGGRKIGLERVNADRAMLLVAKHTFAAWVTCSLYHNVTGR
jgi:hypothetical protein